MHRIAPDNENGLEESKLGQNNMTVSRDDRTSPVCGNSKHCRGVKTHKAGEQNSLSCRYPTSHFMPQFVMKTWSSSCEGPYHLSTQKRGGEICAGVTISQTTVLAVI